METDNSEQSSLEILRDFAEKTGRKIETTSEELTSTGYLTIQQTKRTAFIPDKSDEKLIFHWYNNPKSFSSLSMYCGVFFESGLADETKISIRKKYFFDRIKPYTSGTTYKTGDYIFDHKIFITGFGFESVHNLLTKQNVQHYISEIIESDQRFKIEIHTFSPDFGPFSGRNNMVCLYIKDYWMFDSDLIEKIFNLASKLREEFL